MTTSNITGISVYLMIDGQLCLAPIAGEQAAMFVGMLPAFQSGQPKAARLIGMPADVAQHVAAAGEALGKHFERAQAQKGKP